MPKNLFEYPIVCFYCDKSIVYKIQNKRLAISDATKRGWSFGKYIICPNCKKRPKNELSKIIWNKTFNLIRDKK